MSKELDALKRIRQETCPATICPDFDKEECCNIIEKGLKALEIILDKEVDLCDFTMCLIDYGNFEEDDLQNYNNHRPDYQKLTMEEARTIADVTDFMMIHANNCKKYSAEYKRKGVNQL